MLAEKSPAETRLERNAHRLDYRGKAYLRFNALPESAPVSHFPEITRMLEQAGKPAERQTETPSRKAGLGDTLRLWHARFIERRQMLRELDSFTDEMLLDLGMTRTQARAEARTPFWRDYQ
ncbi:DUF1127 domain-containing protein [Hoeflea sp.]|uniref:DUF1127 domain-containing protein n=1 Tax=Hoeflea sp. TaxID=1940281 RepID=UPI003749974B